MITPQAAIFSAPGRSAFRLFSLQVDRNMCGEGTFNGESGQYRKGATYQSNLGFNVLEAEQRWVMVVVMSVAVVHRC